MMVWMGRANCSVPQPQRMERFQAKAVKTDWSAAVMTSAAGLPSSRTTAPMYSPLGVTTRSSSSTAIPLPRAKPSAALVGRPSASKAALTAGPSAVSSEASPTAAMSWMRTASRRGVAKVCTSPWLRRASAQARMRWRASVSTAVSISPAGSSSVPISNRSFIVHPPRRASRCDGPHHGATESRAPCASRRGTLPRCAPSCAPAGYTSAARSPRWRRGRRAR